MRRLLYAIARLLGDIAALRSGRGDRIARRIFNKAIGRTIARRLWWR